MFCGVKWSFVIQSSENLMTLWKKKNKQLVDSEAKTKKALELSEQANKLMVGRELKMVELKKEIN